MAKDQKKLTTTEKILRIAKYDMERDIKVLKTDLAGMTEAEREALYEEKFAPRTRLDKSR